MKPNQIRSIARTSLFAALVFASAGCNSLRGPNSESRLSSLNPLGSLAGSESPTATGPTSTAVTQAGGSPNSGLTNNRLVGFVTGRKVENLSKGKELYLKGDALFKQAMKAPKGQREKLYGNAAKLFEAAGKQAPGSGLEQDALFMRGEALFFANDLNGARDALETLQKEFPRNRHTDRAAARLFAISRYWIDVSKSGNDAWYTLNLFDEKRPLRAAGSHAVRVLDQIRYDDPTGRLADDATMAAAAEHIRNQDFEKADQFLTDLRETFTDSDHLFLAHLLGIQCKLEVYEGPNYSALVLNEAEDLVKQTQRRFPRELQNKKYADLLARASATVAYHQAEKLAVRARMRRKQGENGPTAEIYRQLLSRFPTTPQADEARQVLEQIADLPAKPSKPLGFMTKLFPDSRKSTPLETVNSRPKDQGAEDSPETGKVIRR